MKMLSNVKTVTRIGEESVHRVVLAGLGACRVGSEQVGMAQHLVSKRVNAWIAEGEEVEEEMVERLRDTRQALLGQSESQINRLINNSCGIDRNRLANIESKVDRLQSAIEKLGRK
ncbi:hypothetical protein L4D12_03690 [Photobacterium nomapromontoriensis]